MIGDIINSGKLIFDILKFGITEKRSLFKPAKLIDLHKEINKLINVLSQYNKCPTSNDLNEQNIAFVSVGILLALLRLPGVNLLLSPCPLFLQKVVLHLLDELLVSKGRLRVQKLSHQLSLDSARQEICVLIRAADGK